MGDYLFTEDYLTNNITNWGKILVYLNETFGVDLDCLEVGIFEGRSCIYLLDSFVQSGKLFAIDRFPQPKIKARYFYNITLHPKRNQVQTLIGDSFVEMSKLFEKKMEFNFIYIDAGKNAGVNVVNLMLAERLLKVGGIMVVDDYGWSGNIDPRGCPKLGIDCFKQLSVLSEVYMEDYQVAFKKIKHNRELINFDK